jgi:hypothetical protein
MKEGSKEIPGGKGQNGKAGKHSHWSSYFSFRHLATLQN